MHRASDDDLLPRLFVELFQTEQSASQHTRVEAQRLAGSPPARAMVAVASHARQALPRIERLAEAEGLATTSAGATIGDIFSALRKLVADRTLDREKSYRGTLIGLYHGVDVVRLVRAAAKSASRARIVSHCDEWLAERVPLVEIAAQQLDWFGAHPGLAAQPATEPLRRSA
jgi:hypothetical protein